MDLGSLGDVGAFVEHSGAVLLVIGFLAVAIGATLLMSTASRPEDRSH